METDVRGFNPREDAISETEKKLYSPAEYIEEAQKVIRGEE